MFNFDSITKDIKHTIAEVEKKYNHKLDTISASLQIIIRKLEHMSLELDTLTAQVKRNSDLLDSATALINGIADRITAAGVDPVKLSALTDELKSKDDVLAAAVVANTPAS